MQKIMITCLLLIVLASAGAQVRTGEHAGQLRFENVLNAPVQQTTLEQLKGKFVLLDFWATWCGSCIQSMPHLSALQKKFGKDLQVILVTDETAKRTRQFFTTRPTNLWFNIDTAGVFSQSFPHRFIPHTVLISPEGNLLANTSPEQVTGKVMDSLLAGQTVHLSEKKDNLAGPDEILKERFFLPASVKSAFSIEAAIPGAGGFSTQYSTDSNFAGRRFTAVNVNLGNLYRTAFGNMPGTRVIDSIPAKDRKKLYCVDIVAEKKEQLGPALLEELLRRFDVQAHIQNETRTVYVITVSDPGRAAKIPLNSTGVKTWYARHGEINQQNMEMKDLAAFLEDYGDLPGNPIVVDETGLLLRYDFKFSFQQEDPKSLQNILDGLGLRLEKAQRDVAILHLYKKKD